MLVTIRNHYFQALLQADSQATIDEVG